MSNEQSQITKLAVRILSKLGATLADEVEYPVVTPELLDATQAELAGESLNKAVTS